MTPAERVILELLDEHGEMYGLDLVKTSNGRLGRGTVYVHLMQLEERGWVASRSGDGARRLYRLTDGGRRARNQVDDAADDGSLVPQPA